MKLIDKSVVVAEIKELYNNIDKCISDLINARAKGDERGISDAYWRMETLMVNTQQVISNVLDTLEVKEVDLDEEVDSWVNDLHTAPTFEELDKFARHFFELGLKDKGE